VTNPIQHAEQDPRSWRLILDESEQLQVRATDSADSPAVTLTMSAARANDLSLVLHNYTRIVSIFQETSEVSSTEDSLARGLRDAAAAARGTASAPAEPTKVTDGARVKAMEILQQSRPNLTHSALVAVVDAAVWWLEDEMDYNAMDLLGAVDDEVGTAAYFTLIGHPVPSGLVESKTSTQE
jgi:hypothetical protein